MAGRDRLDGLYVVCAFAFQIALIIEFLVRRLSFDTILHYGWIFYALSIPAAVASVVLMRGGKDWWLWLAGFLFLAWAIFGFVIEYVLKLTTWRSPILWPVFIPYVVGYLATNMFYWWPLARISRQLWLVQAVLFVISVVLNAVSHGAPQ
jgi:hypothetical protein